MNRHVFLSLLTVLILWAGTIEAKEINLDTGETFRQGDLTITCGQASTDVPLAIHNCQHWDNFNKKCLFEKTTYLYHKLECIEECQYWDKFNSTCHYQTKCSFSPPQKAFARTTCDKFDTFNNHCERTKETRIGR